MTAPKPGKPVRGSQTGRPIMTLLDLLGRRWTLRILWELREETIGFRVLHVVTACLQVSSRNGSWNCRRRILSDKVSGGCIPSRQKDFICFKPLPRSMSGLCSGLNANARTRIRLEGFTACSRTSR
jgi:hypothetical protein